MRFLHFHWTVLLLSAAVFAQSPDDPKLVTSDIANFWKAYDAGQSGQRAKAFQQLYLDPGSPGLQDFLKLRIESAAALAFTVNHRLKFYETVRPFTLKVDEQIPTIRQHLARFRELYPNAKFPTVYFVIGRLNTGGTTSANALLIGTEVNSLGPGVDTSEIEPSFRQAMGTSDRLPLIVIHELTHTQAKFSFSQVVLPILLSNSVGEGAADFMAELVTGTSANTYHKEFGEAHRDELFARFAHDLATTPKDVSHWIYNYGSVKDEPADLGYWIGAEICRSYYSRSADNDKAKAAAIRNIVTLTDIGAIVRGSQYAYLLDKP
jgi:Predicted Zn-dependent protease (DUF2268)